MIPKVLVTVKGGLVTAISTTTEDIEITVVDEDILGEDDESTQNDARFTYFRSQGDTVLSDEVFEKQLNQFINNEPS